MVEQLVASSRYEEGRAQGQVSTASRASTLYRGVAKSKPAVFVAGWGGVGQLALEPPGYGRCENCSATLSRETAHRHRPRGVANERFLRSGGSKLDEDSPHAR
jgi:hypothetical protein